MPSGLCERASTLTLVCSTASAIAAAMRPFRVVGCKITFAKAIPTTESLDAKETIKGEPTSPAQFLTRRNGNPCSVVGLHKGTALSQVPNRVQLECPYGFRSLKLYPTCFLSPDSSMCHVQNSLSKPSSSPTIRILQNPYVIPLWLILLV